MTREMILESLLNEPAIKRYCSIGGEYSGDLYQSTWLAILEMPEKKLIDVYQKGYLLYYIFKITNSIAIKEQIKQKTCQLENIKTPTENLENMVCARLDVGIIQSDISKLHWYEGGIFELYLQEGSYRKVEAKTKIGYNSIKKTVQKVRKFINNGIK